MVKKMTFKVGSKPHYVWSEKKSLGPELNCTLMGFRIFFQPYSQFQCNEQKHSLYNFIAGAYLAPTILKNWL